MTDLAPELWPNIHQSRPSQRRCFKQSYTKVEAQTVVNSRMNSRNNRPDQLRIYHCERCNGWHVTHKDHYSE